MLGSTSFPGSIPSLRETIRRRELVAKTLGHILSYQSRSSKDFGAKHRRCVDEPELDLEDRMKPTEEGESLIEDIASDGEVIHLEKPLPPKVSVGEHDAVCLYARRVRLPKWDREAVRFGFQIREIGPANEIVLNAYANLGSPRSKLRLSLASKLGRWWRTLADFDPTNIRRDRIALAKFKSYLFRVIVRDVEVDNRQQSIPVAGRAQVVAEIVAVISRKG